MLCAYKTLLSNKRIVLASTSERRKEILSGLGIPFEIVQSPFDEELNRPNTSDSTEYVMWTASQKARTVVEELKLNPTPPDFVIGADTMVVLKDEVIGKPKSKEHAQQILTSLSNSFHSVVTGISIHYKFGDVYKENLFSELTKVKMTSLTDKMIRSYVETGEPLDKAGAYGIQGLGASLIERIDGDYYNVMGFPLFHFTVEMVNILEELGEIQPL